jgi:hypothetical protein
LEPRDEKPEFCLSHSEGAAIRLTWTINISFTTTISSSSVFRGRHSINNISPYFLPFPSLYTRTPPEEKANLNGLSTKNQGELFSVFFTFSTAVTPLPCVGVFSNIAPGSVRVPEL